MPRIRLLYLSGPSLHPRENAVLSADIQEMCEASGFSPLPPDPEALSERELSEAMAREIYAERVARMRRADAAVLDLTPFQGPRCDPAVAFEAGFMAGLGKPVMGYMNLITEADAELAARLEAQLGAEPDADGVWRDFNGALVEDYGLPESLMLWAEARRLYVIVTPNPQGDLTGLQLCLDAMKLYSD